MNKNYNEEKIDRLINTNQYFLETNLHNFRRRNEIYTLLCRRYLNTYGSQTQLEDHMSRCIDFGLCNLSYMNPNKKIKVRELLFIV